MLLNPRAVSHVQQLIDEGAYRMNIPWRSVKPSLEAESRFLDAHGLEDYSRWYLAIDPAVPEDSPARYQWPVGDFRNVHRSGLIAARDLAAQHAADEVQTAADDLLFIFDRLTAC